MTISGLTVAEQAALTAGASMWATVAVAHAGIPSVTMADGPMGIASGRVDERDVALLTPCGTALGASWDAALVTRVGALVGGEAVRCGVDLVLAPNLNLPRSPLVGRSFELLSEDPLLTGLLGAAWIEGLQSTGTGSVAKHVVCNDSETERNTMNAVVDERTLREVYLLPFEIAAERGAAGLLMAYNRVNGTYCAEHPHLLTEIIQGEWKFPGLLVSDWFGTMSPASLTAGLSLEMPGPGRHMGTSLVDPDPGRLAEAAERVARTARRWSGAKAAPIAESEAEQLLVEAAAAGFTLLKNDGGLLPLVPGADKVIAVIGPNASAPCFQGGTFAKIAVKTDAVSPVDAIRERYSGQAEILYEPGVDPSPRLPVMNVTPARDLGDGCARGMTVDYFASHDLAADPVASETRAANSLTWFAGMHDLGCWDRAAAVRASGRFTPKRSGTHLLYVGGTGSLRLLVDGKLVFERQSEIAPGDIMGVLKTGDADHVAIDLDAGKPVLVEVEFRYGQARVQGLWYGIREPDEREAMMARAVAAAQAADAVVLVVGETSDSGVESRDRETTLLDPAQIALIEKITAANPRTVIVANVGHAFDTSWDGRAPALLLTWYPGQEFGRALSEVLAGDREPGGRMPVSIAMSDADYPVLSTVPDAGGDLAYVEGTRIGYRGMAAAGVMPRHAFGSGFGYARFALADGAVERDGDRLLFTATVRNLSDRAGSEVVQVYRQEPELTLIGFAKPHVAAGGEERVRIPLDRRRFQCWQDGWVPIGDRVTVVAGRSSDELPMRFDVALDWV